MGIDFARSAIPASISVPTSRRALLKAREVRVGPGATAFTVMPNGARSTDNERVKPMTADFDAAYAARRGRARRAAADDRLMIRPQRC